MTLTDSSVCDFPKEPRIKTALVNGFPVIIKVESIEDAEDVHDFLYHQDSPVCSKALHSILPKKGDEDFWYSYHGTHRRDHYGRVYSIEKPGLE